MDIETIIKNALKEDIASGDVTSGVFIPAVATTKAVFVAKDDGVICGLAVAEKVFKTLDKNVIFKPLVKDGKKVKKFTKIAVVEGKTRVILTGERTALNFLQHLSGIATLTRRYVDAARGMTKIYDTRKTTPLLRELEKYAVRCGGGTNHRMNLSDMALIKDNHLRAVNDWESVVKNMRLKNPGLEIEIEAQDMAQVKRITAIKPDVLMLDNMDVASMRKAIKYIRANSDCEIEISGNVNLDTVEKFARLRADRISVGKITHSAPAFDISLEF
jgi:nicotinate-nucleotide pyrophosphorylase (carboxylating)